MADDGEETRAARMLDGRTRPPIVAIGASAGGLDPLEAFFEAAPVDAGWAFFVIQHLSPDYRSMMDELLGRRSSLTIRHAEDGMAVEPDTITLAPPNTTLTLEDGRIRAQAVDRDEQPHLPIDAFFRSLATESARDCFAVVLSGSGADGARGAQTVQRAGGRVIVQTPSEAKFASMPRAVIATGAVDRVLAAREMPAMIADLLAGREETAAVRPPALPSDPHAAILALIERQHHIDFSGYKKATVLRRIERRQTLRGLPDLASYRAVLESDPDALEELYHDLLIGVTEFYRDPDAFAALERTALPGLVEAAEHELRVWVPGCASGEEAYSLAIAFCETMRRQGVERALKIIATDVHHGSIERAAAGVYPAVALAKLPDELRERYFREHRDGFAVEPSLRRLVIFSVHNALVDPPFMRLDMISCRNLMIYLDDEAQERLLAIFQFALSAEGVLFLGSSESLGAQADDFVPLDSRWRIYRWSGEGRARSGALGFDFDASRSRSLAERRRPLRPPPDTIDMERPDPRARSALLRAYDRLLKRFAPASILVTAEGEVLTWFGEASDYVDTMSDLAERRVEAIVHEALHYPINVGIERLRRHKERRYAREVTLDTHGERRRLALTLEALSGGREPAHFVVVLERQDTAADKAATPPVSTIGEDDAVVMSERVSELERELKLTEESLQYVTERLETSGEELQASNEELQASNEELQAANEELQSSNEELHAVNEELVTVSTEHQRKIDELTALQGDTEFVFEALGIGVVMLDADLRIRRFTALAGRVLELMAHDEGRRLGSVGARFAFAEPADLVRRALEEGGRAVARGETADGPLLLEAITGTPTHGERDEAGVVLVVRRDAGSQGATRAGS